HLSRSASRSCRVASQALCVVLLPLLDRLPRPGQMLQWRERAEERRIGRVGGLARAAGKISLVAEPVHPRVTIDKNSNVERILRAKYRVCVIGAERHVGANKVSRRDRSCHARAVVIAVRSPQWRELVAMSLRRIFRSPALPLPVRLMAHRAGFREHRLTVF